MKLDFLVYFYNTKKAIWCQFYHVIFLQYSSLTVSFVFISPPHHQNLTREAVRQL